MSCSPRLLMVCLSAALVGAGCASQEPAAFSGAGDAALPGPNAGPAPSDFSADAASAGDAPAAVMDVGGEAPGAPPPGADASPAGSAAGCTTDNDCQLVSNCCACQAIPRGEKPTTCDPNRSCVMSVCAQYKSVDRARCSAGRCVLGFECDTAAVVCKRLPPLCPLGQVPQVVNNCYGECVDARQCTTVPSCAVCSPSDPCVRTVAAPAGLHCQSPVMANLGEK